MPDTLLSRTTDIFTSRLNTLAELLKMAEGQWREEGKDPESLMGARLAADMFPLPHQVYFACKQANDLAAWCSHAAAATADPKTFKFPDLTRHIAEAIVRLKTAASRAQPGALDREKRTDLVDGMYVLQPGHQYVDDLLMPNFYFHLVTAYDILRSQGAKIGKKDFMTHIGPSIRREPQ